MLPRNRLRTQGLRLRPPRQPIPQTSPRSKDALDRYNKAVEDGRVQDMIDSIATTNPTQKKALVLMGRLTTASGELYETTKAKFGAEGMEKRGAWINQLSKGLFHFYLWISFRLAFPVKQLP
ncbi:MAG: hypothetical protein KatS3mg104_0699 [Phycisphaerae bacterium]|nr:MAG: hypothetical protein KatS3mg104_0699 [Phycisphaerae bacterium]